MARGKRHTPEQIVSLLRQIEVAVATGKTTAQACKEGAITEQTYYRWRKEFGGLQVDQARRLKELEQENANLHPTNEDLFVGTPGPEAPIFVLIENSKPYRTALQQLFNLGGNPHWSGSRGEAVHHAPVTIDKKLGEVPGDASDSEEPALALFQEAVQWVRRGSVHIDLGEDGKTDTVILRAECANLLCRSWFLMTKLIARKAEHGKAAVFIRLIEPLKPRILRREAAFARGVDEKQDLAPDLVEAHLATVEQRRRKSVDGLAPALHSTKPFRSEDVMSGSGASKVCRGINRRRMVRTGSVAGLRPARLR
jgi:putative transposase